MKAQITLRSGIQLVVDVEELTTERRALTKDLAKMNWVTPAGWLAKLHTIELEQILAIVLLRNEQERETEWETEVRRDEKRKTIAWLREHGGDGPDYADELEEELKVHAGG